LWEWCLNEHNKPDFDLDKNPELLANWRKIESLDARALRGGSFLDDVSALRGSLRFRNHPDGGYHGFGFRVVARAES
jgi:formylglycine-generating enzyme required for sulfatase activity